MKNTYEAWKKHLDGSSDAQILEMMTIGDIEKAFSGDITFGTGGLREIMGLGANRMNRYTVERVTHGLAKTILTHTNPKSVCVAYDTRYNSSEFARMVCDILTAFGIDVYIFNKPMPTPALSFTIRYLRLGWGVVITASHNPQEYNGYKVYDCSGVQVTDHMARTITEAIDSTDFFELLPDKQPGTVKTIDTETETAYLKQITSFVNRERVSSDFPIIYSALHGTGANAVPAVLNKLGYAPICIQQNADSAFGGLETPNPEEPIVYSQALDKANNNTAKLIMATDPDCDRIGVMVKTQSGFKLLNGNQIGALLIDFLAQTREVTLGDTVISTIVSGLLGELVSKAYGLDFVRLLTGFKYIGEYAEHLPEGKQFFFGYEESYGFLAGDGTRDKDAVMASAMIVKMADYYDQKGMTLLDRWTELSQEHGFCLEALNSAKVPTIRQKQIMYRLREGIKIAGLIRTEDYLPGLYNLPPSDVLKLYFRDGGWAAIRPSGTEPKIKLYTGARAKTISKAQAELDFITKEILSLMEV